MDSPNDCGANVLATSPSKRLAPLPLSRRGAPDERASDGLADPKSDSLNVAARLGRPSGRARRRTVARGRQ